MTQELEQKLEQLKAVEEQIKLLEVEKKTMRSELFTKLKEENLKTYDGEVARITQVERKTVKYADKDKLLSYLETKKLVKYFDVILEEIIPEHNEINKEFEKDVKEGKEFEGVELVIKTNPMIKFR